MLSTATVVAVLFTLYRIGWLENDIQNLFYSIDIWRKIFYRLNN
jgi:hypothetical protein